MDDNKLRFVPFRTQIDLAFYSNLFKLKLNHAKLDDSARPMIGVYVPTNAEPNASARMLVFPDAMSGQAVPENHVRAEAFIKNYNTMDEFRDSDKTELLQNSARQIWDAIKDGTIYECPSLLSSFLIISYADLKKYKFTYWAAYPSLHSDPSWIRVSPDERLTAEESTDLVEKVGTWRYGKDDRKRGFFLAKKIRTSAPSGDLDSRPEAPTASDFEWAVGDLGDFEKGFFDGVPEGNKYVCFVDPSTYPDAPSWPLRNLLVLIRHRFHLTKAKIICYRDIHSQRHAARSVILNLGLESVPEKLEAQEMPKVTGWERNANQKLTAQQVNLASLMDPNTMAESATDLNLKLMKWRLVPDLNLDGIKNTKCLLLGAGTLGGYVARGLTAWNVRTITFVDYGNVSYSNPPRQPLFTLEHCHEGGAPKAATAAQSLRAISAGVTTEGHSIEVPMLGHPILNPEKSKKDFDTLKELVDSHDAIFLLMDTRESRWLPTLMGKAGGKIVLNAALGFDTFVAMRHGAEPKEDKNAITLGCYFCNDIVAPDNSTKNQTLDQQCTVTLPDVAFKAAGELVLIFSKLVQHAKGIHAPAPANLEDADDEDSNTLGHVAHQVRGSSRTHRTFPIRGESYPYCSACSPKILETYRKDGWAFVERALNEKEYVTELSGLAEVQRRAEEAAKAMEEDDDFGEMEEDGDGELI